jgi:hypothetical protein
MEARGRLFKRSGLRNCSHRRQKIDPARHVIAGEGGCLFRVATSDDLEQFVVAFDCLLPRSFRDRLMPELHFQDFAVQTLLKPAGQGPNVGESVS